MIHSPLCKSTLLDRVSPPAELRFDASGKSGLIEGWASTFGGPPDSYGDIIAPGAFKRTLAEHKREGTSPLMLWAHDQTRPIGRWTEMREDERGLFMRGSLNLETQAGREAHAHLRNGDVNGLSIGFVIPKGGARIEGPHQVLTDIDLMEASVVAFPANRRARLSSVKTLGSKSELIELLETSGLAKAAARRVAAGGWPALAGEDHQKAIDLAAEIQRATQALRSTK